MYNCYCYYSRCDQANTFDCRNGNLNTLPQTALLHTDQLLASGNNFGNIQWVDKYVENITDINLRNSRISYISDRAMKSMLKNLKTFLLGNNLLEVLPQTITESNNDTKLWISNNSYDCNCGMTWMRDWLVKATNVMDKDQVVCAKGKMIGSIHEFSNAFEK